MITFIEAKGESQLQLFANFKVKLMAEINLSAFKLGFIDKSLQDYSINQALKSIGMRDNFLISYENNYIGNFQVSVRESLCETKLVAYLHNVYIKEDFRRLGIGRNIIDFISESYKKPIECECWYGMNSLDFFSDLGFKKVRITLYSDQNCMSENK